MTPPPGLSGRMCRKSSGKPIIFPSQFMTIVSSSVQTGLEAFEKSQKSKVSIPLQAHNLHSLKLLTQVNPRQLIASASISPNNEGNEFKAGKYACIWGLCQCVTYSKKIFIYE